VRAHGQARGSVQPPDPQFAGVGVSAGEPLTENRA